MCTGACSLEAMTQRTHVRHARRGVARRFVQLRGVGLGALAALLAVAGPGLLAGLSDDDPAGVATYSTLGAEFGYELLWVIPLSTALLIGFHVLAIRLGILSGRGFAGTIRARYGPYAGWATALFFVLANFGTICAEFAGIAAAASLAGIPAWVAAPLGAVIVIGLILGASFHRVEHVLLALSTLLASYVVAVFLSGPDWEAAAHGLVTPSIPTSQAAMIAVTATIGTTLAPWGLAFIQSYAVDKDVRMEHWNAERVEVVVGSLLTGVIGAAIAITCAAVLHPAGVSIEDASDAARALEPFAGQYATLLFGVGLLGAALLAAAIVPLATAYSLTEAFGRRADLDDAPSRDPFFYGVITALIVLGAAVVAIPGIPLFRLIYVTQVVNAILLPPMLFLLLVLNRDVATVGERRTGTGTLVAGLMGIAVVLVSLGALGYASSS